MRNGFLGSIAALLCGAGLTLAQAPLTPIPALEVPPEGSVDLSRPSLWTPPSQGSGRFWFGSDYLLWWTKNSSTPPLLISGPVPGFGPLTVTGEHVDTSPGFIGLQTISEVPNSLTEATVGSNTLIHNINDGLRTGARFTGGYWLDSERTFGIEASYFFLNSRTAALGDSSTGVPVLAIPFINGLTGQPSGYSVASPVSPLITITSINTTPAVFVRLFTTTESTVNSGQAAVTSSSRLQGYEANAIWSPDILGKHMQALAGFRYAQLEEGLNIASSVIQNSNSTTAFEPALGLPTGNIPVINDSRTVTTRWDQFGTINNFYGGQLGVRGQYCWGRFSLMADGKLALGVMEESVNIIGASSFSTTATVTPTTGVHLAGIPLTVATGAPNVTTTTSGHSLGGLFAQPTNMGHFSRDSFAVIPETNIKVGYQITDRLRATIGYTFLYMSDVVRPGDQIDRVINPGFLSLPPAAGNPARPLFQFKGSDYWAQGIDFGLEFHF